MASFLPSYRNSHLNPSSVVHLHRFYSSLSTQKTLSYLWGSSPFSGVNLAIMDLC